ncbi:sulfite oxidase [Runella aurantiaca]|uniref:Molybdopterin containing oxidoreductase n=1 Tax=Runella aurantiaca TaxID=2282308 RepID=A0A369IJM4_9BACT|nr:sulfite oxidase [Runella aurantiaca]RDB07464.1 molybdopterin containing oxidoreductase [Runella aurantiaca]
MSKTLHDRRGFLKKSALTTLAGLVGTEIVFAENMPQNHVPLAFDEGMAGKHPDMIVLSDKPWNVETPPHLLDDAVTPIERMFIRNNGLAPEEKIDPKTWSLTIKGESVKAPKTYSLSELKTKFKTYTYQLVLECGGNGRSGFVPQTSGNQWDQGAVSCAEWTGVRLKDILNDVGLKDDAVYIGYYGKDLHPSRDASKVVISRGVPIKKALEDETLVAWAVNGQDLPLMHGFPLRLVIGGWPASVSGKWLHTIAIRNKEHDGAKMDGQSYRVPRQPISPGEKLAETPENFRIIESMPVKSLITYPKSGAMLDLGKTLSLRGHAWAGDVGIKEVQVSVDYGATWQKANVQPPKNRLAWQRWSAQIQLPKKGYYEVWARATDANGVAQPMVIPAWNPGGYLNNACHRIAVKAV